MAWFGLTDLRSVTEQLTTAEKDKAVLRKWFVGRCVERLPVNHVMPTAGVLNTVSVLLGTGLN